jgi:hypothetical protein
VTFDGAKVVVVVVEVGADNVVVVPTLVGGSVVDAEVEGKWVAAVVGTLLVRASTKTPTATATTTTRAALNG